MSRGGRRLIVLSLILGVHALLALVLLRESALRMARAADSRDRAVETISASLMEKVQAAPQPFPDTSLPHEVLRPAPMRDVSPLEIAPIEVDAQPITPGIIDWRAEAGAAAADVLERARRKASENHFGHAPNSGEATGKPGVFGSDEQNHRAGRVEGGSRFWVTDNCYYDFPRGLPPPARMAGEFHLMTPTCKPPPTGGGDRMFDHLKPKQ